MDFSAKYLYTIFVLSSSHGYTTSGSHIKHSILVLSYVHGYGTSESHIKNSVGILLAPMQALLVSVHAQ